MNEDTQKKRKTVTKQNICSDMFASENPTRSIFALGKVTRY